MSEWPEHSAELARKSLDHLTDQAYRNASGTLSDAALWLVADSIATVTQGLIDKESWETIYEVRESLGQKIVRHK